MGKRIGETTTDDSHG